MEAERYAVAPNWNFVPRPEERPLPSNLLEWTAKVLQLHRATMEAPRQGVPDRLVEAAVVVVMVPLSVDLISLNSPPQVELFL